MIARVLILVALVVVAFTLPRAFRWIPKVTR